MNKQHFKDVAKLKKMEKLLNDYFEKIEPVITPVKVKEILEIEKTKQKP